MRSESAVKEKSGGTEQTLVGSWEGKNNITLFHGVPTRHALRFFLGVLFAGFFINA